MHFCSQRLSSLESWENTGSGACHVGQTVLRDYKGYNLARAAWSLPTAWWPPQRRVAQCTWVTSPDFPKGHTHSIFNEVDSLPLLASEFREIQGWPISRMRTLSAIEGCTTGQCGHWVQNGRGLLTSNIWLKWPNLFTHRSYGDLVVPIDDQPGERNVVLTFFRWTDQTHNTQKRALFQDSSFWDVLGPFRLPSGIWGSGWRSVGKPSNASFLWSLILQFIFPGQWLETRSNKGSLLSSLSCSVYIQSLCREHCYLQPRSVPSLETVVV